MAEHPWHHIVTQARLRALISIGALALATALVPVEAHPAPDSCAPLFSSIRPTARLEQKLRGTYSRFSLIGEADNREFIAIARRANEGAPGSARLFLDVENALIKELNDKIVRDKDLVTGLTNLHKALFWDELRKDPEILAALVAKYSDFKSLRFAFSREDDAFQQRLSSIHLRANARFEKALSELAEERGWMTAGRKAPHRLANWHLAGTGASPDEAGLAARNARKSLNADTPLSVQGFAETHRDLLVQLEKAERLRSSISESLQGVSGALTFAPNGRPILSAEAIETIRKVSPAEPNLDSYLVTLQGDFADRFGRNLTRSEAQLLHDYVTEIDRFSPGIYAEKRVVIDLAQAGHGVISADFKGQNARNLEETAKALAAGHGLALKDQIRKIRAGEAGATEALERSKAAFSTAAESAIGAPNRTFFSGDDGIFMPQKALNDQEKKTFLSKLMAQAPPESFRITFVPSVYADTGRAIPAQDRSGLIVEAESIEKLLRKKLIQNLDRLHLNNAMIAVDFHPREGAAAEVGIYLRSGEKSGMSPEVSLLTRAILAEKGYSVRFVDGQPIPPIWPSRQTLPNLSP